MKLFIQKQHFFERMTGEGHAVDIYFTARKVYEVYVDGEFYATAENLLAAHEEIIDIVTGNNWSPIRPV